MLRGGCFRCGPVMASGFESERSLAARREQRRREREALLAQVGCPARPGPASPLPGSPLVPSFPAAGPGRCRGRPWPWAPAHRFGSRGRGRLCGGPVLPREVLGCATRRVRKQRETVLSDSYLSSFILPLVVVSFHRYFTYVLLCLHLSKSYGQSSLQFSSDIRIH